MPDATNTPQADQELNPDLAGYTSVEALVKAHRASGTEAKRLFDENLQMRERIVQAESRAMNSRQDIPQRSARPEDRLAEFGVPVDALREYVNSELQSAFAPIAAGLNARNTMMSQYKDYSKFESDVAQFIKSDPSIEQTYQRVFAADPSAAYEYAYLKFGESRRRGARGSRDDSTREESAQAAIPGSRNGEARRQPEAQTAEVQKAFERYQEAPTTSNAQAYARARLHTVIKDDFLNE